MKKYIVLSLIFVFLIAGCFYLVFSRDENLTITYIKFKVNPEFVVGINSNNKVVMYNPLNEEAKIFNLSMFSNKTLNEMCEIFVTKIEENNYLENNDINVTVMTKNLEKRNSIYKIVNDVINVKDSKIVVNLIEPNDDELLSYSNEVVFDLETTYQNEDLIKISEDIIKEIKLYVDNRINSLKLEKLSNEKKKEIIDSNNSLGYFNDFDIKNVLMEYDIIISNRTKYDVVFNYDDELIYTYDIILNMEFDHYNENVVDDTKEGIVEVYKYTYNSSNYGIISEYKNHFYKFVY